MQNKTLIFDLDATLYYVGDKIERLCDDKVVSYLIENIGVDEMQAHKLIKKFREKYRYDSEAVEKEFPVKQRDFVEYVCDVSADDIPQDKELAAILKQISNTKYILTDSTQKHSKDVLNKMQVDVNLFTYIYDAHDMNYVFKYRKECFEQFLSKFNLKAKDCIMFEDSAKNLEVAKSCGMITVYIKPNQTEKPKFADYMFSDIKTALKEFFQHCV